MIDKRNNNDWTDALRERLDSSVLPPSSDIWSKVESRSGLAVQGAKADRRPVFAWATAAAVAASLALFLILGPFRTVPPTASGLIAEEYPESVMPAADLNEEIDVMPAEQVLVAEAALPVKRLAAPSEHAAGIDEVPVAVEASAAKISDESAPEAARPVAAEQKASTEKTEISWGDQDGCFTEPAAMPKRRMRLALSVAGVSGVGASGSGNGFVTDGPQGGVGTGPIYGGNISSSVEGGEKTKASEGGAESYQSPSFHHYRPFSLGLALTYPVADRWFLESGLNYSYLRSDIHTDYRGQKLHFLGVPVKVGYILGSSSHFSVSLSAGAMAEKLFYGEAFGKEVAIKEPQLSAVASAAVQYRVVSGLNMFLAPEFSYYLTKTAIPSYHTEHPASLTLRLGVNVKLGPGR